MNRKIKIMLLVFAVQLFLAANCQSRTNKEKVKAKWNKDSADIKLKMAQEQFEAGQYEQAEESIRQCFDADPNISEAKLLLGKVKVAKEDYSGARSYLEDYIGSNDRDDAGLFLLAFACERSGDNASAMKWYKKALETAPDNTDYIIAVGQMYQAAGNFVLAEFFYKGKMAANQGNTDLKAAAAQMYLAQGKNDKALQFYEQASMLKPESSELLEALGSCYIITEQWAKALEVHQQLYLRSDDLEEKTRYLKTMAITAANAGDYNAAVKYYSVLTSQDKYNARLWLSMGQAALGADSLSQAIVCSRKVLELSPDMKEAWLLSGSANYKNCNYLQAAADFQKAAGMPQQAKFAWLMAGRCYEKLGRAEQANTAYEKAEQFETSSELQLLFAKGNEKN
jgi:tetratricopeptide (TPR) repeat protein